VHVATNFATASVTNFQNVDDTAAHNDADFRFRQVKDDVEGSSAADTAKIRSSITIINSIIASAVFRRQK
jgi:hypothetical protein